LQSWRNTRNFYYKLLRGRDCLTSSGVCGNYTHFFFIKSLLSMTPHASKKCGTRCSEEETPLEPFEHGLDGCGLTIDVAAIVD